MDRALFRRFCTIAQQQAGIALSDGKQALVSARVAKRLRALGLDSPRAYIDYLDADDRGEELVHFLDAISTNFTSFFREADHFAALGEAVHAAVDGGARRLRLWSAACSTGEEPYCMAITAREALGDRRGHDIRILATDISTRALDHARAAVYAQQRLESVPAHLRTRYFDRLGEPGRESSFRVAAPIRTMVAIKRLNLAHPPFPMHGPLDAVFCRNVMIYFGREVRQGLVGEIERLLKPGGLLMIGHSETLTGLATGLELAGPALYRKPQTAVERQGGSR